MMRSTAPTSGPEVLRKIADLATIFDPDVVRRLVRLYLRLEREPASSTAQRRTAREAMALCAPYVARFEAAFAAAPLRLQRAQGQLLGLGARQRPGRLLRMRPGQQPVGHLHMAARRLQACLHRLLGLFKR